jgi:hypothetical protein
MKTFCLTVLITALTASAVSAQTKHGWGNKTVNGSAPTNNSKPAPPAADDSPKDKIEGTWRTIETFPDNSAFKVLFTFSAGSDDKNGTTIHTDELFFTGGPSCFPSQGVWKRTGDRTFLVTDEGFCFDPFSSPIFGPVGKIQFKSALTLNPQGTALDGPMHVEAFDVNGVSVFTTDGVLHGERMKAEGP